MTRSDRHRLLLATIVLLLTAGSARAQEFSWSRATVGLLPDGGPVGEDRAQTLLESGFDAVAWPAGSTDGSSWGETANLLRKAGLRVLLAVDEGSDPTSGFELANRAFDSGFDGILSVSVPVAPPTDEPKNFRVVAGDAAFERIAPFPGTNEALEALFARRARSPERPEAAPLALPDGAPPAHWMLLPGPVAVPVPDGPDPLWQTLARFRARHPALADGVHGRLSESPYAFFRGMRLPAGGEDIVLVVLGAEGRIRINVSTIWPDDIAVRDAVSGAIALVSFGQLSLNASPGGLMLIEPVD